MESCSTAWWGIVKVPRAARFSRWPSSARARSAGARHFIPDAQGPRSQLTVVDSAVQMSADPVEILDDAVHRGEALQMGHRLEPAHPLRRRGQGGGSGHHHHDWDRRGVHEPEDHRLGDARGNRPGNAEDHQISGPVPMVSANGQ